jgi:hypothetical protein
MGMVSDHGHEHETVLRRSAATIFDDRCAIDLRTPRQFTHEILDASPRIRSVDLTCPGVV